MNCSFREAVDFEEAAFNTTAQCPICGAHRTLKPIRHNGETTDVYLFPTHPMATRRVDRPSWRRTRGEYGKWTWHTVEVNVTIVHC